MAAVLTGFGIIALVILVGYIAGRFGVGGPTAPFVLNRIAFFITNPALLFVTLAHADLRVVFSTQLLVAAIAAVVAGGLFLLASRLFFRRPAAETTGPPSCPNSGLCCDRTPASGVSPATRPPNGSTPRSRSFCALARRSCS